MSLCVGRTQVWFITPELSCIVGEIVTGQDGDEILYQFILLVAFEVKGLLR
jgi:hypothetical protein